MFKLKEVIQPESQVQLKKAETREFCGFVFTSSAGGRVEVSGVVCG